MDTVLLSVYHKGNRRLLKEWLESRYTVIEAETTDQPFDLWIVDAVALVQCEADILAHKERQAPLFTPVLLIVQRKDVGLATRNLWKTVDELVLSPIEKIELQARVHNLILARRLSLDLKAREDELLQRSEERYRSLVETIPGVVYIADLKASDATLFISPQVERLLGIPYREWQSDPKLWLKRLHPADRERVLTANERCRATGEPFHEVYRLLDRENRVVWVEDQAATLPDETGQPRWLQGAWIDITERKRAEEALQKSEERLKHVLANAPDTIYTLDFSTGKATFLNREEFCGYSKSELEAPGSIVGAVHPDDLGVLKEHWMQMMEGKNIAPISYRLRKKDGTWAWIGQRVRTLAYKTDGKPKEVLVSLSDITERKQAEEKMRESEEKFSNAFNVGPAAMTITRITDGKFIDANESFFRMFGFTRDEVIGHTSLELNMLAPDQRKVLIQEQLKAGGLRNAELLAKTKSGAPIHLLFSSKPMRVEGEECLLTTLIDITDRKQAEEELRLSRDRLAELSKKLVEAREAESRAIGRELHDQIGQMLTALKLTLEIAPQLPSESAAQKYAQAQELVGELMNGVSRLSLDLRPPMLDDLGLVPALLWHVTRFQEQTQLRVDFHHSGVEGKRFAPEIETTAYRVIQEGLTNAARHARADRVRLEVYVEPSRDVRADADRMEIQIEDDGVGFNVESALAQNRGLGGMRERVDLLNGTLRVQSEPGQGARIHITLPLK